MNIYKVTLAYFCYDAYDGHIVTASSAEEAINMCFWADAEDCGIDPIAELIGTSNTSTAGIIFSSFNAG